MNIQDAMVQATENFGGDVVAINDGECADWAEFVANLCPDARMDTCQYADDEGDHDCYHAFVRCQDKVYDAECPSGVADWEELPFIQRQWRE